jgi:hypothetical protein
MNEAILCEIRNPGLGLGIRLTELAEFDEILVLEVFLSGWTRDVK